MKLDPVQQDAVQEQLNLQLIPDDHDVRPQLVSVFGDHSFFLGAEGLNVVEPQPDGPEGGAALVKIASWSDDNRTELVPCEPEYMQVAIEFATEAPPDTVA